MVNDAVGKFAKIDILIPSAGVPPIKDLEGTSEEDFDKTFALNVKGPYFICQVRPYQFLSIPHVSFWGLC